jgi:LacI family transcriptional regulator
VPRQRKAEQKRLRRIAYVMSDHGDEPVTANPFYGLILNGVEQACRNQSVGLSFITLQWDHPRTTLLPPALADGLDGILLAGLYPSPLVERIAHETACPLVLIDNMLPNTPWDSIMADDFGGGYEATQHLLALGHRHIMMVVGLMGKQALAWSFLERYRGYQAACTAAGITPQPMITIPPEAEPNSPQDFNSYRPWLEGLLADKPTAFFCAADLYSLHLIGMLNRLGLDVPHDISVASFDDINFATMSHPTLTTVHSFKRFMARIAVERLLARIEGDDLPPLHISLGVELITRESTGPAPTTKN